MNTEERMTYAVAVKAAARLEDTVEGLLHTAAAIYTGMVEFQGTAPPQEVASKPIPAASVVPSTDPGSRFSVGDTCPKCQAASLILKTNKDGSKAWLQCADKKTKKQGDQWVEAGACSFGPFDESYAYEARMSLWQT